MEEGGDPIWRGDDDLLVWEGRGRGSQYGRREYDLPYVGSPIWNRRGNHIRKRGGISLCRKKEVGDPNMEEERRSICVGRKR
jgi:hypothetical protein